MSNSFDESLKLTNITLLCSGIRIYRTDKRRIVLASCLFYFNLIWLYTDVLGEFYWLIEGIQSGKSFSELTLIAPCATICLLATAKSVPMYYNREKIVSVVEKLKEIHPEFDDEPLVTDNKADLENTDEISKKASSERVEKEIVEDSIKFLNFVILLLYYSSAVVIVVFSLLPLLSMSYDYYKRGETELKLPFLIKYFFDPFTKTLWPLVYIHQVWSTFVPGFNVFGADTFLYAFCSYIQMHFRILCHRFEHIVSDCSSQTNQRLKNLVEKHQLLIKLVDEIEMVYSRSTLFNIISSSVLICLSGFNVTFLDDVGAVFAFFTFLVMSLSQISLLCFFGDMLMRSSMKVGEAIYKSRWYTTNQQTKKSILLIIIRAQKPCKLTAADFANLNLSAFTTILSRSWSYFALLKTMYK